MIQNKMKLRSSFKRAAAALALSLLTFGASLSPIAQATNYQSQINALNAKNAQTQADLSTLEGQAQTYQNQINALQEQINSIQTSINANEQKQADLQAQIVKDQQQIAINKQYLAADLKTMYVDGQMTTIEELATSNNLSDYVDKEQDRAVVQDKLNSLLKDIQKLQAQAQDAKHQVDVLLASQKTQESTLAADQNQVNQLLSSNQSQQSQDNKSIATNNAQISSLRRAQAAANASIARRASVSVSASSGSGGKCDIGQGNGGYPYSWCNATQDSFGDSYGFPVRECTSFANWYFKDVEHQSGFHVSGNAGAWWETSNYSASTYPDVSVGAIGVEPGTTRANGAGAPVPSLHGSYYGHVMIVKALPNTYYSGYGNVPSGYVLVASMNEDEEGHFMYNLWPVNYLMYINPR